MKKKKSLDQMQADWKSDKILAALLLLFVFSLLSFLYSCSSFPDSYPEEVIEEIIEDHTGLDIDLTADEDG